MRKYICDPEINRDYRKNEIHPSVYHLMENVRYDHRKEVPVYAIDKAIALQQERSIVTACNFIRYFLLHELNYVDVFGRQAVQYDHALQHYKQCENMELKVDILTDIINDMSAQMNEMQKLIINMAKIVNRAEKTERKYG